MTTPDRIYHELLAARLLDELADAHGLKVAHQAGKKRTLYATQGDLTIPVAEVGLFPRTLTPLSNRKVAAEPVRKLRTLGWSG